MTFTLLAGRLPLEVDARGLRDDADALAPDDWVRHFNEGVYEGDWSGAAFRAPGGDARRLYPDFFDKFPFADTPLMERCPHVASTMRAFRCPLLAVRFLRLAPGARIKPHRDYDLGFDTGEIRLHAAVRTDPDVLFELEGERLVMNEGALWYADFSRVHTVTNASATPRIHLVLDCIVNDWLTDMIANARDVVQPSSAR